MIESCMFLGIFSSNTYFITDNIFFKYIHILQSSTSDQQASLTLPPGWEERRVSLFHNISLFASFRLVNVDTVSDQQEFPLKWNG